MKLLNEKQFHVFKSIIYLKRATKGQIAQATGMHRQSVRIILRTLKEKDFIKSEMEKNKEFFSACGLNNIKNTFLKNIDEVNKNIPSLSADYQTTKDSQVINHLQGKLGLRSVLMDEIIKGKEICAFHLSKNSQELEKEYKENDKRRITKKIPLRMIKSYDSQDKPLTKIKKTNKKSKTDIFIYANKVAIMYKDVETSIFTIKIDEVTKFFKDIFEKEWKKSVKN